MKTSVRFDPVRLVIVEELAALLDTRRRNDIEVYKNPTRKEFDQILRPLPEDPDASMDLMSWRNTRFDGSRNPIQEVRAILVDNDLYAWNYEAVMHATAMLLLSRELGIPSHTMLPIYLDVNARDRSLAVRLGKGGAASAKKHSSASLFKLAQKHRAFREWTVTMAMKDDGDDD